MSRSSLVRIKALPFQSRKYSVSLVNSGYYYYYSDYNHYYQCSRDDSNDSRDCQHYYHYHLIIYSETSEKIGFQIVAVTVDGNILCFSNRSLDSLSSRITEAPEHHTQHGDEKSGSEVLLRVHSIGVDYELRAKVGSVRKTWNVTVNCHCNQ